MKKENKLKAVIYTRKSTSLLSRIEKFSSLLQEIFQKELTTRIGLIEKIKLLERDIRNSENRNKKN